MLSAINEQRGTLVELDAVRNELARELDESTASFQKMSPETRPEAEVLAGELRGDLLELERIRKDLHDELVTSLDEINAIDGGD